MSAYKDKTQGTWYVSFRYIDWTGKKTQKLKRGFKTKKEALNYEKEFIRKTAADMKMEMNSFIQVYFEDKKNELKENSIRNKQHMMNKHIVPYFGTRKMNEITPAEIIQWQNTIQEKGYSKTYERMIQNQLNALFNHAQKIYNLKENPCKKVKKMGKSDANKLEFWTKAEYDSFIAGIEPESEDYLIFEILFWTGIREGELLALSLSDFDMSGNLLHINKTYNWIIPYVTDWKGKGMDTRVSLKQVLKSLGFQGGNKHDTELNQWINHEKEVLAETAKQYGIEWEQKGTHEEHLDVYNFKKKERKKEVQELEQEKEHLTAEKEELTAQIAESRADIQNLKDDKEQAIKAKQEAEQKAGSAEKELKSLEDRREQLQPIMDSVSKEIKEYGTVKMLLPEAGTLERAVTYRDKKIKPLFLQIKNKVAVMAAQVKELTKEVEGWKRKYQKVKQKYNAIQRELDDIRKDNQKLSEEKDILQGVSDRYDRVVRVLGIETVDTAVQQDIQNEKVLEEKRRMEQMPKGNIHERLAWGMKKSEMENQQRKKNKSKNREMER